MRVSIITINYNNSSGLEKTIQSVLAQTVYDNIEYIVIDGASTDGSVDVIHKYENRLSLAVSEPDKGIYDAMNKGVTKATGDYCLFLNSGDTLFDELVVETCLPTLGDEDLIMGRIQMNPSGFIAYNDISLPFTMMDFYLSCPIPHPACFIRRELFDICLYDDSLRIAADCKLFMQMVVFNGKTCKLLKTIISTFEEGGISVNKYECDKERKKVLDDMVPQVYLVDYEKFEKGEKYTSSPYNDFFFDLMKYNPRCARILFSFTVRIVKFLSKFAISLRFVEKYLN